jgi:hypothetical protein
MNKPFFAKIAALVLVLCMATGCFAPRGRIRYVRPVLDTTLTVASLIAWQEERAQRRAYEREMLERSYAPLPPAAAGPALRPSLADRVTYPAPLRSFDGPAARASLNQVDLSACKAQGAERGWGHAKLTFTDQGYVAKVAFDEPAKMDPAVMRCIGDKLGTARAPAFIGADVTMGYSWFVQ